MGEAGTERGTATGTEERGEGEIMVFSLTVNTVTIVLSSSGIVRGLAPGPGTDPGREGRSPGVETGAGSGRGVMTGAGGTGVTPETTGESELYRIFITSPSSSLQETSPQLRPL